MEDSFISCTKCKLGQRALNNDSFTGQQLPKPCHTILLYVLLCLCTKTVLNTMENYYICILSTVLTSIQLLQKQIIQLYITINQSLLHKQKHAVIRWVYSYIATYNVSRKIKIRRFITSLSRIVAIANWLYSYTSPLPWTL